MGAVLYSGSNAMPRCLPSSHGQTGPGSFPCAIIPRSGLAAYDVGTPQVSSPRSGGKTYFSPWRRNSSSALKFGRFFSRGPWSKWLPSARRTEACTSDGLMPQPAAIPERVFKSANYRITRPTEVNAATFNALRSLAKRTALPEDDDEAAFPEGREVMLQHRARERNSAVVQAAKAKFLLKHGRFACQACGFDFEDFYGEAGQGFIEAHHTIPVSELRQGSKTKAADIALVCSNCHRMLHRRRPWITMSDLKTLLESQGAVS